jgi:hypothetical protein
MSPIINQKFLTEIFYWLQISFSLKFTKTPLIKPKQVTKFLIV